MLGIVAFWVALGAVVFAVSGLLSALIWRHKGGTTSHGLYLGCTTPIVGVLMAIWMSPDGEASRR